MSISPHTSISRHNRDVWGVESYLLLLFLIALGEMEKGLVAMVRSYLKGLFTEARGYYWEQSQRIIIYRDLFGMYHTVSTIVEQDILEPRILTGLYSRHIKYHNIKHVHYIPGDFRFDSTTLTRVSTHSQSYDDSPTMIRFHTHRNLLYSYTHTYTFREHIEIVPPEFKLQHYFEKRVRIPRTKIQKGMMRMRMRMRMPLEK